MTEATPFSRTERQIGPDHIDHLVFRKTDNDGFWHRAMLVLRDGLELTFVQGSCKPHVRARQEKILGELRRLVPTLDSRQVTAVD